MTDTHDDITLEEGQVWEWDEDDDETLLHDATVTIDDLFWADDGTPMVTFTEPADGVYDATQSTATRANLKQSLDEEYRLRDLA